MRYHQKIKMLQCGQNKSNERLEIKLQKNKSTEKKINKYKNEEKKEKEKEYH